MKFKNLIKMEKETTEKRYRPFIDKFKSLKGMNLKEEISKRNYIKNENSRLNKVQQMMMYKIQAYMIGIIVIAQAVLLAVPKLKDDVFGFSITPLTFVTLISTISIIICFINNIVSIKSECNSKKAESFQAISSGLLLLILALQLIFIVDSDSEYMMALGGNIILDVFILATIITQLFKIKKLKEFL